MVWFGCGLVWGVVWFGFIILVSMHAQSHNDWDVGEKVDRDYDWSKFKKTSLYGVETPHDNSGQQVNSALHWLKRYITPPPPHTHTHNVMSL